MLSVAVFTLIVLDMINISASSVPSWNMHFSCGQTISQTDRGGFLNLNSDLLPAGYKYDCKVVIQPHSTKSSSTSGSHVLFHFSDFEVGKYCQDSNVTVLDGDGLNIKPIGGLKNPLCGTNSSLNKDVTFITQSYFITVIFQRNSAGANFKSKFNLTFLSFSEGSCGTGDKNLFTCTNKRCIDKKFTCQNINPCGDFSDCPTSSLSDGLFKVVDAAKYVGIVVFIIFISGIFYKFIKHRSGFCDAPWARLRRGSGCLGDLVDNIHYRCSECRCGCRNCCRNLVARLVAVYNRIKTRFTSNTVDTHQESRNGTTQAQTQVTEASSVRNRPRTASQHSSSVSEASHNYQNEAYNSEADSYSINSESISRESDTERPVDAPPSYRDAAAAPRPLPCLPTAPPYSPETMPPPTYEEAMAYIKK